MAAKEPRPEWISRIISDALRLADDNVSRLAESLQVSRGAVNGWKLDGTTPGAVELAKLLAFCGGDIQRALPGYDPQAESNRRASADLKRLRKLAREQQAALLKIARLADEAAKSPEPTPPPSEYLVRDNSRVPMLHETPRRYGAHGDDDDTSG